MSTVKKADVLLQLVKFGIYGLFVVPMLNWHSLMFSFETTKGLLIIVIAEIVFVLYLWLISVAPQYRPSFGLIEKTLFFFIAIFSLASFFGIDPLFSFWGDVDRMTGGFIWLHLIAIFVVLVGVFRSEREWLHLFSFSIGIALFIVFLHFLTKLGFDLIPDHRAGSTFGNSSYFAVYLLFHVFFSFFVALHAKTKQMKIYGLLSFLFLFI